MYDANPFTAPGRWYKGGLHTHSTGSDGKLDPAALARYYRAADYDFLALTDHDRANEVDALAAEGLFPLLGLEISARRSELPMEAHVVGVGLESSGAPPKDLSVPEAIAWLKACGGE